MPRQCAGVWRAGFGEDALCAAVAQELVRSGRRVLFTTCSLLVQDLLAAKREYTLKAFPQAPGNTGKAVILDGPGLRGSRAGRR